MPTFTTIALETLLEPRLTDSYRNSTNSNQHTPNFLHVNHLKNPNPNPPTSKHIYISPALYTTPEPTPVTSSSVDSLSPSPYVFNRKGRGGKGLRHRLDAIESEKKKKRSDGGDSKLNGGEVDNGGGLGGEIRVYDEFLGAEVVRDRDEEAVLDEDLLDTRCETSNVATFNQGEFFDADEEFFSDGSVSNVSSSAQSIESVLRATRLSLLEEIEKRKSSEEALDLMYNQWQRVADVLSKAGVPSNASSSMQLDVNSIEQFVEEIVIARFVAEAIGKGQARAEAEIAAEEIIQSKDHEISRLRDRLQYYEAVNREMSQRNQEVMGLARRQRHRKKGLQQRWLWGFIGLSIAIGASVIAYSCLPQTGEHHIILQASTDSTDASCICSSESA